ncbi:MAG TPA: dephospho-CoA kinase [Tepidisphaeraceae bacterium]|nr:dephospho-CoA kinase [Tepidisphaeraceae bacterium]
MFSGKPVIGIAGGIGSGKSFVARLFGELGCLVINSDEQVADAYRDPAVKDVLRQWWGDAVIRADGQVDRGVVAGKIFKDSFERRRLEELIHPRVSEARRRVMEAASESAGSAAAGSAAAGLAAGAEVVAFVWDTPLLFETSLNRECDAVVFVDAPNAARLQRVREGRGWDAAELARREISQWPLDRKREISDYVVSNTADAGYARGQVRDVLSRILVKSTHRDA